MNNIDFGSDEWFAEVTELVTQAVRQAYEDQWFEGAINDHNPSDDDWTMEEELNADDGEPLHHEVNEDDETEMFPVGR
jgi:hypothetical protein